MTKTGWLFRAMALVLWGSCYGNGVRTMGSDQPGPGPKDAGSDTDGATIVGTGCSATPAAPPSALGLDSFYGKYLSAKGVPVVASAKVADLAVQRACAVTAAMTAMRDDVLQAMIGYRLRVAIIATSETLTSIPEYRDLPVAYPQTDWSTYRGLAATLARPVTSTAEENVLCLSSNTSPSESILVYTLAHAARLGASQTVPAFDGNLRGTWSTSIDSGLWANTSAALDATEYWALGTLAWYDAAAAANPANGSRNQIHTRAELKAYDPMLTAFVMQFFPEVDLPVHCP